MATLRELLDKGENFTAPGCGDPIVARICEEAGFKALYLSGYYASACVGYSDLGEVTMSEMVEQTRRVTRCVSIPLIADADDGYGGILNVMRTTREFEAAGAAAIHLEDQPFPKVSGSLEVTKIVEPEVMCDKLRAAIEARKSREFVIIARSDCFDVEGADGVIRRGKMYREAGADALQLRGLLSGDDIRKIRKGVDGPLMFSASRAGMTAAELHGLGIQAVLYPLGFFRLAVGVLREAAERLHRDGDLGNGPPDGFLSRDSRPVRNGRRAARASTLRTRLRR